MKKDLPKFVSVKNLIRLFPRDPLLKKNVCNSKKYGTAEGNSSVRGNKKGSREVSLFYHPVIRDDSPQGHWRPVCLSVFCAKIPDPDAASDEALLISPSHQR
jgi:hypothetical protein